MSLTNCENMTAYATNEYALNTSLSKFPRGNYALNTHVTGIESLPLCMIDPMISTMYLHNEYVFHKLSK